MEENNTEYQKQMNDETFASNEPIYETPGVTDTPPQSYVTFVPYGFTPKTYEEKKSVKKSALIIGLSLVIMLAITLVWSSIYIFIMGRFGFTADKAYGIISDPAVMQVLQIVLSILMFTVPFIIIYKSNGQRISDLVPLSKPKKGNRLAMFFIGIAFCSFANIAVSQASYIFEQFGIDYNVDFGDNPEGFFGFLLSFLATVVVPGLVEEFACRGLILGLLRKYGDGFAVLVSAIVFGIMHGNFEQMPFAFLVGLVLGYIVVQTNSLWIAIAVHATNNFVSVAFDYFLSGFSQSVQNLIYSLFLAVCLLLGIFALSLNKDKKELYEFKKSDTESKMSAKCKWFFTSPAIIIFIVICVLESLIYF